MLLFSEGVPRSGKSYDAVKSHILPALKRRRHVYVRLNGLNHERIAAHLEMPLEDVQALLHVIDTNKVIETFQAQPDETGKWVIPEHFKNALVVVDEVHEFYVGGTREPMPPASEQFFALHGHYGMDVLLLTQFYKRVHTALRYRIERKTMFQKLSVLGKKGEMLYLVAFYQTVAPDKFERVSVETRTYDPAIYPLYHGIVGGTDGDVQQYVYVGGRSSVWRSMMFRAVLVVPLALFGIWFLFDFFSGGASSLVGDTQVAHVSEPQPRVWQEGVATAKPVLPVKPVDRLAKMTPEQRFVWELSKGARIRFVGVMKSGVDLVGIVEWLDNSMVVKDALTLEQLRALGVIVTLHQYGLRLSVGDEVQIATAWPVERPRREASPRLYDTSGGRSDAVSASEPRQSAAGSAGSGVPIGNDWRPPSSGNMVRAAQ